MPLQLELSAVEERVINIAEGLVLLNKINICSVLKS